MHRNADSEGRKKYSPPRRALNVSMPWIRRLTGACGIVNVAPFCCRPTFGSRSSPSRMRLPLLIHSRCRNSSVSIAFALRRMKYRPDYGLNSTQGASIGRPAGGGNLGDGTNHTFNAGTQDTDDVPMGSSTVAVKPSLNDNGYTSAYVSPDFVEDPTIASYQPGATPNDGAVFPDRSAYKGFVL